MKIVNVNCKGDSFPKSNCVFLKPIEYHNKVFFFLSFFPFQARGDYSIIIRRSIDHGVKNSSKQSTQFYGVRHHARPIYFRLDAGALQQARILHSSSCMNSYYGPLDHGWKKMYLY